MPLARMHGHHHPKRYIGRQCFCLALIQRPRILSSSLPRDHHGVFLRGPATLGSTD